LVLHQHSEVRERCQLWLSLGDRLEEDPHGRKVGSCTCRFLVLKPLPDALTVVRSSGSGDVVRKTA